MLKIHFDPSRSIVILEPGNPLTAEDFNGAISIIDNHLALRGKLRGIIVRAKEFSCWQTFQSALRDIRLFEDHHLWIKNIALVTDASLTGLTEPLAAHFINASVRQFQFDETEHALGWIRNDIDYG